MAKKRGARFWLIIVAVVVYVVTLFLSATSYSPARATACTVTFGSDYGGGTEATYDLYSDPMDYIVYTGTQLYELPYWWGGSGIPGYGIQFSVGGGCSTLRVASATWHIVGNTGHYWEWWTGGSHNADGDINATANIPIETDIVGYGFLAGNLDHTNPYDYVTFRLYTTEGDPGPTSTPTLTPTSTPTLPAPPPTGAPGTYLTCQILGNDSAYFRNWPGAWSGRGDVGNPGTENQGLAIFFNSEASLMVNLDPAAQYSIDIRYHRTIIGGGVSAFLVSLGKEDNRSFEIEDSSEEQQALIPDQNYVPSMNDSLYKLTIRMGEIGGEFSDPGLVVDYICIIAAGQDDGGGVVNAECKNCTYIPGPDLIENIGLLAQWFWCLISQLFTCVILTILMGLWQSIVNIIKFIALFRYWLELIILAIGYWLQSAADIVSAWLNGILINVVTAAINALANMLKDLGLDDFLNLVLGFLSGSGDLITLVLGGVTLFFGQVVNFVTNIFNQIVAALGLIPILFASVVNGFNATSSVPAYAPACSTPGTVLYVPCLGMYVLDNTIFDGPFYFVFPVIMGFVAFNAIMWSIREVKDTVTK